MAFADKKMDVYVTDFSGDLDDEVTRGEVEVLEIAHLLRLKVDLLRQSVKQIEYLRVALHSDQHKLAC